MAKSQKPKSSAKAKATKSKQIPHKPKAKKANAQVKKPAAETKQPRQAQAQATQQQQSTPAPQQPMPQASQPQQQQVQVQQQTQVTAPPPENYQPTKTKKAYIIRVSSTKGGVGKSSIATNLAVSLQLLGYQTLIVDLDTINPSVGLYLGLPNVNVGVIEAMTEQIDLRRVIVPHAATGLHMLPGRIEHKYEFPGHELLDPFFERLSKLDYEFIIVDTQPGIPFTEVLSHYDEAVVVTLPDEASTISAIKMIKHYGENMLKSNILVNRVTNRAYELSVREIEEMCETRVLATLPEDDNVKISIAEHIPLVLQNKNSPFSKQILAMASVYSSRTGAFRMPYISQGRGVFGFLKSIFGRR